MQNQRMKRCLGFNTASSDTIGAAGSVESTSKYPVPPTEPKYQTARGSATANNSGNLETFGGGISLQRYHRSSVSI